MTSPPSRLRSTSAELDGELVRARIAITDQFLCSGVKILFGTAHTFFEQPRRTLVENFQSAARPFGHLIAEESGVFIRTARRQCPHLSGWGRIAADAVLIVKLGCGHELLDPIGIPSEAEMRISEFGSPDALLLLFGWYCTLLYFPMQKVLKIRFRMSSLVVAPVISSRGRRAP